MSMPTEIPLNKQNISAAMADIEEHKSKFPQQHYITSTIHQYSNTKAKNTMGIHIR